MNTLLGLLLGLLLALSPLILCLSLPVFIGLVWFGVRRGAPETLRRGARAGLVAAGCLGLLMDAAVAAFVVLDNPHGRFMDCIDSGLFTGVPTLFLLWVEVFTLAVIAGLGAGWWFGRSGHPFRLTNRPLA